MAPRAFVLGIGLRSEFFGREHFVLAGLALRSFGFNGRSPRHMEHHHFLIWNVLLISFLSLLFPFLVVGDICLMRNVIWKLEEADIS